MYDIDFLFEKNVSQIKKHFNFTKKYYYCINTINILEKIKNAKSFQISQNYKLSNILILICNVKTHEEFIQLYDYIDNFTELCLIDISSNYKIPQDIFFDFCKKCISKKIFILARDVLKLQSSTEFLNLSLKNLAEDSIYVFYLPKLIIIKKIVPWIKTQNTFYSTIEKKLILYFLCCIFLLIFFIFLVKLFIKISH